MNQPLFSFIDTDSIAQIDVWTNLLVDCASQIGAIAADPTLSTAEKVRLTALVNADLALYTAQQTNYVSAIKALLNVSGGGTIGGSITTQQIAFGAPTADSIEGSPDFVYVDGGSNNITGYIITQTDAGTAAKAQNTVANDLGSQLYFGITSSGFTGYEDASFIGSSASRFDIQGVTTLEADNIEGVQSWNGVAPTLNYVLKYNGTQWEPAPESGGSGTITDWVKVQPIPWGSGSQEVGSNSALFWRRVGDSMEIRITVDSNGTGVNASGDIGITIPDGQTIDLTKLANAPTNPIGLGETGWFYVTTQGGPGAVFPAPNGASAISFWSGGFGGAGVGIAPLSATQFPFANGGGGVWLSCKFSIPIVAWA